MVPNIIHDQNNLILYNNTQHIHCNSNMGPTIRRHQHKFIGSANSLILVITDTGSIVCLSWGRTNRLYSLGNMLTLRLLLVGEVPRYHSKQYFRHRLSKKVPGKDVIWSIQHFCLRSFLLFISLIQYDYKHKCHCKIRKKPAPTNIDPVTIFPRDVVGINMLYRQSLAYSVGQP